MAMTRAVTHHRARHTERGVDTDAPTPREAGASSAADVAVGAALFRSLGDPSRLVILQHLLTGEHRVVDLTDHLGLAQSTVSAHLACLRDCGLVTSRPAGRATMWSLTAPGRTVELLAAAEELLGATGSAVALCPSVTR